MKKIIFIFILTAFSYLCLSKNNNYTEVTYYSFSNNEKDEKSEFKLKFSDNIVYLSEKNATQQYFMDYNKKENVNLITYNDSLFAQFTSFDSLPSPTLTDQTESILGYDCKHAIYTHFSNKIEVWYTEITTAKGSPYRSYIPNDSSLVLKIIVNDGNPFIATSLKEVNGQEKLSYPIEEAKEITEPQFEELRIKSRYVSIPIFKDKIINYGDTLEIYNDFNLDKTYRFSKGTVILKKIKLPEIVKEGAFSFVKLTCSSNGDAYDRTGSVFTISENKSTKSMLDALKNGLNELPILKDNEGNEYQGIVSDNNYQTPVELMRFITSFGVGHFNKLREINNYPWENSATYNQDVSSLIPDDQDEIWIGVFIGNYDKGGHKVSLELNFYPTFEEENDNINFIHPLFYTVNIMEMSGQNYGKLFKNDTLKIDFEIPENIENAKLLFTTTGHGGWGNGDEFNQKLNSIYIDGEKIFSIVPWRTDCATYRMLNPASGNFGNGLSSSDFSRSNWCPGTLTCPYVIPLEGISSGFHKIEIVINQGNNEGNQFNSWNVSGILVGEKNILSKD